MRDIGRLLSANAGEDIGAAGDFIFIKSATGDVRINVQGRGDVIMQAGDNIKLGRRFEGFRLEDASGAQNTVVIAVGDGDEFARSTVQGAVSISGTPNVAVTNTPNVALNGTPTVIARDYDLTRNIYKCEQTQNGGNHSVVQLWNPVASGRNAIVRVAKPVVGHADRYLRMKFDTTAYGTDSTRSPLGMFRQLSGTSNEVCEVRLSAEGSSLFNNHFIMDVATDAANETAQNVIDWPIWLAEGQGVHFRTLSGQSVRVAWEWEEVAI